MPASPERLRPIYFPQTFLSPAALESLQRVFRSITVLQPGPERLPDEMQPFVEGGFLEAHHSEGHALENALRDYRQWGDRHYAGIGMAAAWRQESAAKSGEGTPSEIAAAIRRRASSSPSAPKLPETLREARLFLQLAQTADRQEFQIRCSLEECDRRHERLVGAIRGETVCERSGAPVGHSHADHMPERMAAWVHLFLSHPCPAPLFVTHHADAVGWLTERAGPPLRVAPAAVPYRDPCDFAARLAALDCGLLKPETSESAERPGFPAVHVWPEVESALLMARALRIDPPPVSRPAAAGRHTLVVQMPPSN